MPKARKDRLIIKELPDETLVYDLDTDKAHCLNVSASLVWKKCNGSRHVSEIAQSLGDSLEVDAAEDDKEQIVWFALAQLDKFKLLENQGIVPASAIKTRRQVIKTLGITAIALPLVATMIVPISAEAASCGQACTNPPDCTAAACTKCTGPVGNRTCTA
jgi:hypothetical protein